MGVFDIEDNIVLTPKQLIGMGFERLIEETNYIRKHMSANTKACTVTWNNYGSI